MRWYVSYPLILVACALALFGSASPAGAVPTSGIRGQVYEPTSCETAQVCIQAIRTRAYHLKLIDLSSRKARFFRTAPDGRFSVLAKPGRYRLALKKASRGRLIGVRSINVTSGAFAKIVARVSPID